MKNKETKSTMIDVQYRLFLANADLGEALHTIHQLTSRLAQEIGPPKNHEKICNNINAKIQQLQKENKEIEKEMNETIRILRAKTAKSAGVPAKSIH